MLSILRTTAEFLEERGVAEPRLSAEHLLAEMVRRATRRWHG